MAPTTKKTGGPILIDWKEVLVDRSSPDRDQVLFASSPSPSTSHPRSSAKKKRKEEEEEGIGWVEDDELRREFAGMSDGLLRREIASFRCTLPLEGFFVNPAKRAHRRGMLEAEARRRGLDTESAAKDGADRKRNDRNARTSVYTFGKEDMQAHYDSHKYCLEPSSIRSANEKCGQLGVNTRRSVRQAGQRKPIPVGQMYKSKPSSTALPERTLKVHTVDLEESDNEKSDRNENNGTSYLTKRRKAHHQDSSLNCEKAKEMVLLDDEDVQPEELVDCGVPDTLDELKIYYPSRDDPEAVELTNSDIKCLDPGVYLSSPVINYYIRYIKKNKLDMEDRRDRFHIFNTYFYSKLKETLSGKVEFSKFRRWWKGVNIFEVGYIILPVHGMAHWSLIIICIPAKGSNSGPIILHLDSLGMHPSDEIFGTIERYLEEELCHIKKNPPSDISISETLWGDLLRNIQKEKVEVPRQRNEYDCGIFMLYYIERFINEAPERFMSDNLDMFSRDWFKSEVASDLRNRVRKLLQEEFVSAQLGVLMSEAAASDGSDKEESTKGGESEAVTPCDSSAMVVEDSDISNEDIEEIGASEEVPSCIYRGDDKIANCVVSEATASPDIHKDEEDTVKADCESSKSEREIGILCPEKSESNEDREPGPNTTYCDSSDSDDMEIIEVLNQTTKPQIWFFC